MALAAVQGQDKAIGSLRATLGRKTVHHAYLFEGPEGVGKELAAIGLAQALLCPERPQEGCGECTVCSRIARRSHPDVLWVMPEDQMVARGIAGRTDFDHTPSRDIRVDQVRKLQERLALRPLEAQRKVCIVADAHRLNDQAQNAFLKTLEEPPAGTLMVLISSSSDKLLPTIRSRLASIRFRPLPRALIARHLVTVRKLEEGQAQKIAALADGSLARAEALDADEVAAHTELIQAFESLSPMDPRTWTRFADEYASSREDAERLLDVLMLWTRDVVVFASGGSELLHPELLALARQIAAKRSAARLHHQYRLLEEALENVTDRNAAPRLQLESLLIRLYGGVA